MTIRLRQTEIDGDWYILGHGLRDLRFVYEAAHFELAESVCRDVCAHKGVTEYLLQQPDWWDIRYYRKADGTWGGESVGADFMKELAEISLT